MLRRLLLAAALGSLAACNPAPSGGGTDAGVVAGPTATPLPAPSTLPTAPAASAPASAAPSAPGGAAPLPVLAFAAAAGTELPLPLAGEPATVDPRCTFRVETGVPLTDAHAVLLDDKGDMVPSSGTTELGQSARFLLTPREPLAPGSRYLLRVETAGGRELRDAQGRVYAPAAVAVRTAGTKPAPPPAAKKRKRGHRRR